MTHLNIKQSGVTALLTTIIGQVVAFVPAFAPDKQILISAGSTVIAAVFLVANAVHHLADSNVSLTDLEQGVRGYVTDEIVKINLSKLAEDAINAKSIPALEGEVTQAVKNEWQRILSALQSAPPPSTTHQTPPLSS